jgi:hypothetical protein
LQDRADRLGDVGNRFLPSERFGAFIGNSGGSVGGRVGGSVGGDSDTPYGSPDRLNAQGSPDSHGILATGPGGGAGPGSVSSAGPGRFSSEQISGHESKFPMYQY